MFYTNSPPKYNKTTLKNPKLLPLFVTNDKGQGTKRSSSRHHRKSQHHPHHHQAHHQAKPLEKEREKGQDQLCEPVGGQCCLLNCSSDTSD